MSTFSLAFLPSFRSTDYKDKIIKKQRDSIASSPIFNSELKTRDQRIKVIADWQQMSAKSTNEKMILIGHSASMPGDYAVSYAFGKGNILHTLLTMDKDLESCGMLRWESRGKVHSFWSLDEFDFFEAYQSTQKIADYLRKNRMLETTNQAEAEKKITDWAKEAKSFGSCYYLWQCADNENLKLNLSYLKNQSDTPITVQLEDSPDSDTLLTKLNDSTQPYACLSHLAQRLGLNFFLNGIFKITHIVLDEHNKRLWDAAKTLNEAEEIILENGQFGRYWGKTTVYDATHFSEPPPPIGSSSNQGFYQPAEKEEWGDDLEYASKWTLPTTKLTFKGTIFNDHDALFDLLDHFPKLEYLTMDSVHYRDLRPYSRNFSFHGDLYNEYAHLILEKMPNLRLNCIRIKEASQPELPISQPSKKQKT